MVPFRIGFLLSQGFIPAMVFYFYGSPRGYSFFIITSVLTGVFFMSLPVRAIDRNLIVAASLEMSPTAVLLRFPFWGLIIFLSQHPATRMQPVAIARIFLTMVCAAAVCMFVVPSVFPGYSECWGTAGKMPWLRQYRIVFDYGARKVRSKALLVILMVATMGLYYKQLHAAALTEVTEDLLPPRVMIQRNRLYDRFMFGLVVPVSLGVGAGVLLMTASPDMLLPPYFNATAASPAAIAAEIALTRRELIGWIVAAGYICFIMGFLNGPRMRSRLSSFLARVASTGDAGRAAGVAAMVGKRDPQEVLALARRSITGLDYAVLREADFASNADSGLNAKAKRCRIGEIDAFLSHSWHDDPHCKWKCLVAWARLFHGQQGRTPILWLDKACLIQSADLDAQLACLPVFLSGCRQLVVLAGPTFTERIWCILEVYTFMRMGGTADRMVLLPVVSASEVSGGVTKAAAEVEVPPHTRGVKDDDEAAGGGGMVETFYLEDEARQPHATPFAHAPGTDEEAAHDRQLAYILGRFQRFDVAEAKASREEDRQHLLGVIELGFGDLSVFNTLVRHLFSSKDVVLLVEQEMRGSAEVEGGHRTATGGPYPRKRPKLRTSSSSTWSTSGSLSTERGRPAASACARAASDRVLPSHAGGAAAPAGKRAT